MTKISQQKNPFLMPVAAELVKSQYNLVMALIRKYGILGTGVLVFVSGEKNTLQMIH
jgi:hypothetical protein